MHDDASMAKCDEGSDIKSASPVPDPSINRKNCVICRNRNLIYKFCTGMH